MIIIAHNIRSLHNIGAIFRNAAAFCVEKVYITGFTASPPRREIAKVALGAEELVDWEKEEIGKCIENLKKQGYYVYGLETGKGSILIDQVKEKRIALVLGNEVEGIEQSVIDSLDGIIEIPMGKKRSLNVSVASGVAMYALSDT